MLDGFFKIGKFNMDSPMLCKIQTWVKENEMWAMGERENHKLVYYIWTNKEFVDILISELENLTGCKIPIIE